MNENYLIFNDIGILTESNLKQVSQGNHNVDYFYIGYYGYDYTNSYLTVAITLPSGTELPELATSQKDFEFNGTKYKGYMIKFLETITAISGNLTMTFILKNMTDDTELFSSQLNITIHETDDVIDPTITELQYNQMQEVIREEFNEINRKIEDGQLKGDKGDKGDSATVSIGVTLTGETGTPAIVENVGTPSEVILNFTIPRGEKGDKGDKGEKGDSGTLITKTSELTNDGDGTSPYATLKILLEEISKLINSAPETLDTLGEIAQAVAENEDVIEILNQAIGHKADLNALAETNTRVNALEDATSNLEKNKANATELIKYALLSAFNDLAQNKTTISNLNGGGAIGEGASAGQGFAGGKNAITTITDDRGNQTVYDSIQLGTGSNYHNKTLQVYDDNIYNANTHTASFQKVLLNGQDLANLLSNVSIAIDSALSSTSKNPVQNKVINEALTNINTAITNINTSLNDKANINDAVNYCNAFSLISNNRQILLDLRNKNGGVRVEKTLTLPEWVEKEFVNSSISTATATFRGTYNNVDELPTTGIDINDYAFVVSTDANGNTVYNRYKYTNKWEFEYALNNSSFTAEQWEAIQSGITKQLVETIPNKANTSDLSSYVPTSRTVNGKALSSNISLGNKDVGALPDYTLTINHGTAGNPRMVKFASVNYSSAATCFKMGAMTCHDNGVSYQFLTDMLIAVTTAGEVTANIYKFAQTSIGNVDNVARYTGDVFYVNDTTNKIVDFYILCGQYSSSQFTPATKVGSTTIANVTQYSGNATYYSSGTKVWVNGCGGTYARTTELGTQSTFSLSGTTLTITPK